MPGIDTLVSLSGIFTVLFVMLGPLKVIGPFARLTQGVEPPSQRRIAILTSAMALGAAVVGALVGQHLLRIWNIPVPALLLTGGLIFFIVGLRTVLAQYQSGHASLPEALPATPIAAAMRLSFPTVVTPYGIATLIVFLASSHDSERTLGILLMLAAVMVLNLLAMLYGRFLLKGVTAVLLEILGAVLGVLQVAFAVNIIWTALREMGVLHAG
mgnify:CR=1 FL=1